MRTIRGKQLYTSAVAAIGLVALSAGVPARAPVILDMSLIRFRAIFGVRCRKARNGRVMDEWLL